MELQEEMYIRVYLGLCMYEQLFRIAVDVLFNENNIFCEPFWGHVMLTAYDDLRSCVPSSSYRYVPFQHRYTFPYYVSFPIRRLYVVVALFEIFSNHFSFSNIIFFHLSAVSCFLIVIFRDLAWTARWNIIQRAVLFFHLFICILIWFFDSGSLFLDFLIQFHSNDFQHIESSPSVGCLGHLFMFSFWSRSTELRDMKVETKPKQSPPKAKNSMLLLFLF